MKITINESQYKRLFKESIPDDVSFERITNNITKQTIKIFEWCHKNTPQKKRYEVDVKVSESSHAIPLLGEKISRVFLLPEQDSLVLSYNFFIRYNDEGDYDQFMGEELSYFGQYTWTGGINVVSQNYGVAEDSNVWVYAKSHDEAEININSGIHSDIEIGEEINVDGFDYPEWEMDIGNIEVDSHDQIEYS
jgi:hypothetical protein|tara:strand:- start:2100 stop:2675 length:576 start_codon:yes stop_codon:yes gene_type:complete